MLKSGDAAPDFAIKDRRLHDLLRERSVVVFFFPKAFSPVCRREADAFRREYENLKSSGCDVVGVSQDSQETNDRFAKELGLPFPLVGDPTGEILAAYQVRWPVLGVAQRTTYLVGQNTHVRLAFHNEFNAEAHAAEACSALSGASTGNRGEPSPPTSSS
jgi:peroxiredoxin Q/BCP